MVYQARRVIKVQLSIDIQLAVELTGEIMSKRKRKLSKAESLLSTGVYCSPKGRVFFTCEPQNASPLLLSPLPCLCVWGAGDSGSEDMTEADYCW